MEWRKTEDGEWVLQIGRGFELVVFESGDDGDASGEEWRCDLVHQTRGMDRMCIVERGHRAEECRQLAVAKVRELGAFLSQAGAGLVN